MPFWDFIQSLDPNYTPNQGNGRGVDHNEHSFPQMFAGFPFGPQGHPPAPPHHGPWDGEFDWNQAWGPWAGGRRGRHHGARGRHGHRHRGGMSDDEAPEQATAAEAGAERASDNEKADTPDTMRADVPDPDEVAPEENDRPEPGHGHGFGCRGGPGRRGGWGGRGGFHRGGRGGPHGVHHHGPGHRHPHGPPPPYPAQPFDLGALLRSMGDHPLFQGLRGQAENFRAAQNNGNDDPDAFVPPVDIFNTEASFVLHVALPGAKKEDIGVNWDPDNSVVNVAGVIHRPGDEAFLQTLSSGERKVGVFERNVTLPPAGAEKDEVDGEAITAKMEDGVLIITVPKVEKEWTEIRKVDIE